MKSLAPLAAVTFALVATRVARAELPPRVDVRADSVAFYIFANASLLAADRNVIVHAGRRTIWADALRYDARTNRLTVTGDVRVRGGVDPLDGTAYSLDLASDAATLLRVDPVPATYLLRGDDFVHATEAPPPPGAFDVLDLQAVRPFVRSRHAVVTPDANARFTPAEFPTGAGPAVALPTYLLTMAGNPNLAYSSLPGTSFDQPYALFGGKNALTVGHARYDSQNGAQLGLDQRFAAQTAYLDASILPFREKRLDLNAFAQIAPGVQQQLSGSYFYGALRYDSLHYQVQHTGYVLRTTLSSNFFGGANASDLTLSTLDRTIPHLLTFQVRAGYGYDHTPGQLPFTNDFRITTGGYVASPNLRGPLGSTLGARYDYSLTTYDYPHEVTSGTATLSLSRSFGRRVRLYGSVSFQQIDDRYRDNAAYYLGLPDPSLPYFAPDGTPWPGYFAYAGLNTNRTYLLQTTIQGRGDNSVQFTLTHTHDFPQFHGYGPPPLSAAVDVVMRLAPTLRVELGRSYTFGWGGQYFSPQYTFSVSP